MIAIVSNSHVVLVAKPRQSKVEEANTKGNDEEQLVEGDSNHPVNVIIEHL